MVYIYILERDIFGFQKLISDRWYDNMVITYYNSMETDNLIMVSLSINDYIGLTDRNLLQKISLLQN
jgi:hypothetical protein